MAQRTLDDYGTTESDDDSSDAATSTMDDDTGNNTDDSTGDHNTDTESSGNAYADELSDGATTELERVLDAFNSVSEHINEFGTIEDHEDRVTLRRKADTALQDRLNRIESEEIRVSDKTGVQFIADYVFGTVVIRHEENRTSHVKITVQHSNDGDASSTSEFQLPCLKIVETVTEDLGAAIPRELGVESLVDDDTTRLINIKESELSKSETVYIGRGRNYQHILNSNRGNYGQFGNPHYVEDVNGTCKACREDHSREESIERYRCDFAHMIQSDESFRAAVEDLRGETLACYCTPEPCHGDVILEYLRGEFPVDEYAEKPRYWARDAPYTDTHPFGDHAAFASGPGDVEYQAPSPVDENSTVAHRVHNPIERPYSRMVYHIVPPVDVGGRRVKTITDSDPVFEDLETVAPSAWITLAHNGDEVTIPNSPSMDSDHTFISKRVQIPRGEPWWPQSKLDRLLRLLRLVRNVQEQYSDAPRCPGDNPVRGQSTREELLETDRWREWVDAFRDMREWVATHEFIEETAFQSRLERKYPIVVFTASTPEDQYPSLKLSVRSGVGHDTEPGVHATIAHCNEKKRCACNGIQMKGGDFDELFGNGVMRLDSLGLDPVWVRREL